MSIPTHPIHQVLHSDDRMIAGLDVINTREQGELYCVGGCIRDSILDRPILDIDFAVPGSGLACARSFSDAVSGAFIVLDDAEDVGRVVWRKRITFDFASFKGPTIFDDLALRDFTINAMACRYSDIIAGIGTCLDPHGGSGHLTARSIVATSRRSFVDDPLRCLRAFRFGAQLDFTIEETTSRLLAASAESLNGVSSERIHDEFSALLSNSSTVDWVKLMWDSGVLKCILPSVHDASSSGHEGLFSILEALESIPSASALGEHEDASTATELHWILKLATILAESCATASSDHAVTAESTARMLRLSKKESKCLSRVLTGSERALSVIRNASPSDADLYDIEACTAEHTFYATLLARAEETAAGRYSPTVRNGLDRLINLNRRHQALVSAPRLVTGDDIMEHFGLEPGPYLGDLLARLEKNQVTGTVATRTAALNLVDGWLKLRK